MKQAVASIWKLMVAAFMICAVLMAFFTMFTTEQVFSLGEQVMQGFGNLFTEVQNRVE